MDERHLNHRGSVQGGLLATLVDFAIGRALRPAEEGDWVEAHTEVDRLGGTLAFANCSRRVGEREVVRGRAVFAVLSRD